MDLSNVEQKFPASILEFTLTSIGLREMFGHDL